MGIGAVFPLFLYGSFADNEARGKGQDRAVAPLRVHVSLLLAFVMFAFLLFFNAIPPTSSLFEFIHVIFQFSPLILVVLSLLPPVGNQISARLGSRAAQFGYAVLAGASFCAFVSSALKLAFYHDFFPTRGELSLDWWLASLPNVCNNFITDVLQNKCALGLVGDLAGMTTFVLLLAHADEGLGGVIITLLLFFLFSPGFAFATAFYRREKRIEAEKPKRE